MCLACSGIYLSEFTLDLPVPLVAGQRSSNPEMRPGSCFFDAVVPGSAVLTLTRSNQRITGQSMDDVSSRRNPALAENIRFALWSKPRNRFRRTCLCKIEGITRCRYVWIRGFLKTDRGTPTEQKKLLTIRSQIKSAGIFTRRSSLYVNWDDDGPRILHIKIGYNTRGGGEYRELDFQNLIPPKGETPRANRRMMTSTFAPAALDYGATH
jgi:hypothetical protein